MLPSRILPTAVFGVAVSFFFVPPVLATMGVVSKAEPRISKLTVEALPPIAVAQPTRRPAKVTKATGLACAPTSAAPISASASGVPLPPATGQNKRDAEFPSQKPWTAWQLAQLP